MHSIALVATGAAHAAATGPRELFQSLSAGGFNDDKLVQLANAMNAAGGLRAHTDLLQQAIQNPAFPAEGRPDAFFTALSAYLDENRDGTFSTAEADQAVRTYAARYADLLRESLAKGPSQNLAAGYRVKTWKLLQKIVLLQHTMRERSLPAWHYPLTTPEPPSEPWDVAHTVADAADFQHRVCEASAKGPVVVKFGSTQCADCMLMEYTQGVRLAAEKGKDAFTLYKLWWGPNMPEANDRLRKAEGVQSSPTFVVYRGGRRYSCGFAFLDESGAGLESCLTETGKPEAKPGGACGATP